MDEGKVVGCKPVIARRDPPTLFDPVEKPLDSVAGAVAIWAEADRIAVIALWRNVGPEMRRLTARRHLLPKQPAFLLRPDASVVESKIGKDSGAMEVGKIAFVVEQSWQRRTLRETYHGNE